MSARDVAVPAQRTPSPGALAALVALLEERTGQQLAAGRAWRIEAALVPLARARGMRTVDDLVVALDGGRNVGLTGQVVDAMLNQESSFFRDAAMLDSAMAAVTARTGTRRARLWSAGCSMGQEPLSLAMLSIEAAEATGGAVAEIVATDVSDAAVARARTGRFNQFEVQRGLPVRRMMRWFQPVGVDWIARPDLLRHIGFRHGNVIADPPPCSAFDAVFCRNVLMYFTPEARRAAFDRLAAGLRPGGILVMGAGETVTGQTARFVPSDAHRGVYVLAGEGRAQIAAA